MKFSYIILVVVLWQVIAAIAQSTSKKKQRQKMAQAQRGQRGGATTTLGRPSRSTVLQPPTTAGHNPRADDLAARRAAQLEELRRRRAAGAGGKPMARPKPPTRAAGRVGLAPVPVRAAPAPAPAKARGQIKTLSAGYKALQASDEQERQERQVATARHLQEEGAKGRRKTQADQKRAAVARANRDAPASEDVWGERASAASRSAGARLRTLLSDRATLRDVFVLREVLDEPRGLRSGAP